MATNRCALSSPKDLPMTRLLPNVNQTADAQPVYDILNCGPNNRFVANGRLVHNSGANKLNLQNLPRGSLLRNSIVAPEGQLLVVCDLAQIEARVLAWIAEEDKITTVFSEKRDLYSEVATEIYGFQVNKKDHPDERWVGKTAALGLGYSMSATKFQIYCGIMGRQLEPSFCEKVVETYRTTYCHIPELWKRAQYAIHLLQRTNNENYHLAPGITFHNHTIILPSQRKLSYEGLNYVEDEQAYRLPNGKKVYGALIIENIVQAISRDILVHQLLTIHPRYPVVMHTHDELIVCVPENEAETARDYLLEVMRTAPPWITGIPLDAEAGIGKRYGDCK